MRTVDLIWQFVMLLVAVVLGVVILAWAIRDDPSRVVPSGRDWLSVGLLVFWAGDAVGSSQPTLERVAKGVAVILLGSALAIACCRRRRQRRQTDRTDAVRP